MTSGDKKTYPVLYSSGMDPFSVRVRTAFIKAGLVVELREKKPEYLFDIQDKPACDKAKNAGPAAAPILIDPFQNILDDTIEMMRWALSQRDPARLLLTDHEEALALIEQNDTAFYPAARHVPRMHEEQAAHAPERGEIIAYFCQLDERLQGQRYLQGPSITFADLAILPFIRHYAFGNRAWFDGLPFSRLQQWLAEYAEAPLYKAAASPLKEWQPGDTPVYLAPWGA